MTDGEILITKASGERQPFSEAKLRQSLQRSGASSEVIDEAVARVRSELSDGMTTSQIYRRAFGLLRKHSRPTAARYSLKKAIMELGPTGFPFEKLVGELLEAQGFRVETARTVQGHCVTHEVDVVATRDNHHVMVECKFHNEPGVKSDVKVALYVQARFEDVQKVWKAQPGHAERFHEAWLVTNTRLTSEAVQYARCVGMRAIGWSYPPGQGLAELLERAGLHPITSLTSLNRSQKVKLLEAGIVHCRELVEKPKALAELGISEAVRSRVIDEARNLCQSR